MPGRHRERAEVVGRARVARGDVVGQAAERRLALALPLLAQQSEAAAARSSATRRCRRRCRRRRCWPGRSRRRRWPSAASRRRSGRAAAWRRRTARGPRRRRSGSSKIAGYFPFSSQVMKNGDQSMYGTISSSGKSRRTVGPEERGHGDRRRRTSRCAKRRCDGLGVGDELALRRAGRSASRSFSWMVAVLAVELGARLGPVQAVDDADAPRGVLDVDDRPVIAAGRS